MVFRPTRARGAPPSTLPNSAPPFASPAPSLRKLVATSDGAAAVIVTPRPSSRGRGLTPLVGRRLRDGQRPAGLFGMGRCSDREGAEAARASRSIRSVVSSTKPSRRRRSPERAHIDPEVNVNSGAIALGHPLGCAGAKLTAALI
jgi:acetyl-CoA acyltransferase